MAKHGSMGKRSFRSSAGQKGAQKKAQSEKTRAVKAFVARAREGERDQVKAEEQIAMALEQTLNKWIQATGYVFNLTINNMEAVRLWNSVMLFVDYTVTRHKDSGTRLQEVMNVGEEKRKEDSVRTDPAEGEGAREAEGIGGEKE